MSVYEIIISFTSVAVGTFILGFVVIAVLRRAGVVDVPIETSSHDHATVTGGGLMMLVSLAVTAFWLDKFDPAIALSLSAVAVVSFIDDAKPLGVMPRLLIQIGASAVVVYRVIPDAPLEIFIGIFWLVAIANATNFFDGLNGLFATQIIVSAGFAAAICGISGPDYSGFWFLMIAASAFGFLFHNFPTARIFAGDVGSITLGLLMGYLTLRVYHELGLETALAIVIVQANMILDTGVTVVRRMAGHRQWLLPHRGFFFHRLMLSGLSHVQVTLIEASIQALLGMLVLVAVNQSGALWLILAGCVSLAVWGCFFAFCELRFRKSNRLA